MWGVRRAVFFINKKRTGGAIAAPPGLETVLLAYEVEKRTSSGGIHPRENELLPAADSASFPAIENVHHPQAAGVRRLSYAEVAPTPPPMIVVAALGATFVDPKQETGSADGSPDDEYGKYCHQSEFEKCLNHVEPPHI